MKYPDFIKYKVTVQVPKVIEVLASDHKQAKRIALATRPEATTVLSTEVISEQISQ